MNKIVATMMITILAISCKNKTDSEKFVVAGEIKNTADQKIYLEQVYFSQKDPETLDTSELKNGKFELSAITPEEGLYRIRLEKLEHGFIFINDKPQINFKADSKDISLEGPVFNSPANALLKKLMVNINDKTKPIMETSVNIDSLKNKINNDSALSVEKAKLDELENLYKNFIIKFIDTASDPVVTMFALGYTRNIDPSALKDIISNLSNRFPKHQGIASLILQYNQFIAQRNQPRPVQNDMLQAGSMAPDFTMNDVNDKPFSLGSLKGKYVLVDFWASWCAPCRAENPFVVAAYNKFKNKNFTILGVSLDDEKAAWMEAIKEDNLSWQHISDLKGMNGPVSSLYGIEGIPFNVLIDPQGKIIATELRGEALERKLSEVLH